MLYYKATLLKKMAKNCDILEFVIRGEGEGLMSHVRSMYICMQYKYSDQW